MLKQAKIDPTDKVLSNYSKMLLGRQSTIYGRVIDNVKNRLVNG